jgi:signal transduction histidine kinase
MRRAGGGLFNGAWSVILSAAKNLFRTALESRFFAALRMTLRRGELISLRTTIAALAVSIATSGVALAEPEQSIGSTDKIVRLTQAKIILTDSDTPPPDSAAWQTQSLPDNWNYSHPGTGGFAWYRIEFDLKPEQLKLSALYVPRISMNGAVMINGHYLGGSSDFTEPMTRQWYRPQFFSVPDTFLKIGRNVIHYRIKAYPNNKGGLSEIHVGLAEPIEKMWRKCYFWQVTSVQITSALNASLGIIALLAWFLWPKNSEYGYFGAAALIWVVHCAHYTMTEIPIAAVYWEILAATTLIWVGVMIFMFALRFYRQRFPLVERLVWGFALAAPLLLWAAGTLQLTLAARLCYLLLLLIGVFVVKVLFDGARRERSIGASLLLITCFLMVVLGAHDWLIYRDLLDFSEPYKLHFGAPITFISVAWNALTRHIKALAETDELNRSLEARVQQKSLDLERSYEEMRAVESARMLTLERERIMRDMHDGVGSQLIAARQLAERGALSPDELATVLNECMDDLRLVIDSLEPTDGDLLNVIGNLRYRLTDRFARQGIELKWEVNDFPANVRLAPSGILHILRIVQEAFANVLKHAGASEVVFSATLVPEKQQVKLSVRDNGRGLADAQANGANRGRGLANMKQRAAAVGGEVQVNSNADGCVVTLTLSLQNPAATSLA